VVAADNVELFMRGARVFGQGDVDEALKLCSDEIEFYALRSATEGPYRGHDGIRAFLADTQESFDVFEPEYDDVRDLGDGRVLGLGAIRIRGRGSGVETDVPSAIVVTFSGGRMTQFKDYGDRKKALEAAGLA
jgi:ketosteroid isomerase-like protein